MPSTSIFCKWRHLRRPLVCFILYSPLANCTVIEQQVVFMVRRDLVMWWCGSSCNNLIWKAGRYGMRGKITTMCMHDFGIIPVSRLRNYACLFLSTTRVLDFSVTCCYCAYWGDLARLPSQNAIDPPEQIYNVPQTRQIYCQTHATYSWLSHMSRAIGTKLFLNHLRYGGT